VDLDLDSLSISAQFDFGELEEEIKDLELKKEFEIKKEIEKNEKKLKELVSSQPLAPLPAQGPDSKAFQQEVLNKYEKSRQYVPPVSAKHVFQSAKVKRRQVRKAKKSEQHKEKEVKQRQGAMKRARRRHKAKDIY